MKIPTNIKNTVKQLHSEGCHLRCIERHTGLNERQTLNIINEIEEAKGMRIFNNPKTEKEGVKNEKVQCNCVEFEAYPQKNSLTQSQRLWFQDPVQPFTNQGIYELPYRPKQVGGIVHHQITPLTL